MSSIISLDTETYYDDECSVKPLGYDRYARHPKARAYLISVCDGKESWAGEPRDFNFESLRGKQIVSHQAAFDEEICLAAHEQGLWSVPGIQRYRMDHWFCSLNMSAYLWNVRSLKDACRIGLGVTVSKDTRDRAKGKTPEDMKREGWWDDMLKYGLADAERCWHLWDKHSHKWPELERKLSRQTIDQGRHGLRIDVEALNQGVQLLQKVIFYAHQNLPWVARGRKPGSPLGVAEECRTHKIPTPPVKKHDPEAAQEWEDTYAPHFKFVMALRNLRKAKKSLATLETIELRLRDDETVAFSLKYAGAHTLRWAGDAGWNLQNQNKEPLFIDPEFAFVLDKKLTSTYALEFDKVHVGNAAIGTLKSGTTFFDMRGLTIARPGMKLAPVDLSQIEPRVLNDLADNKPLLAKIRQGLAIYEAHARETMPECFEYPVPLKESSKKLYALAKARVLGLGYGCGWEKFVTVAMTMAQVDITEGDVDFALAAAIDGKIYKRRKALNGKDWDYAEPHVFAIGEQKWAFTRLPDQEGNTRPWEDFVFVRQKRKRKGQVEEFVGPLQVYGMRSRVTVEEFRRSNPLITALWKALDDELRASEGRDLVITGPHGHSLTYYNVRAEKRKAVNKETGETYQKTVYTAEIGGFREILYGGLLCENITQWVARMVFAERQLDLHERLQAEDARQWVLFTVHDEAVPEILDPAAGAPTKWQGLLRTHRRARQLEAIMSISPAWLPDCPLGAEAKVTNRYCK